MCAENMSDENMASHDEKEHQSVQQRFEPLGLARLEMIVAQGAARVGARKVLKFNGASPDTLNTVLKASAGMTPVTAADLASEEVIVGLIKNAFPDHGINAEESKESIG